MWIGGRSELKKDEVKHIIAETDYFISYKSKKLYKDDFGWYDIYKKVSVPVKLYYGSNDWAKESDKLKTQNLLKLNKFETIEKSAHFSFLENTNEVAKIIKL